jgi:hypothetical protein
MIQNCQVARNFIEMINFFTFSKDQHEGDDENQPCEGFKPSQGSREFPSGGLN